MSKFISTSFFCPSLKHGYASSALQASRITTTTIPRLPTVIGRNNRHLHASSRSLTTRGDNDKEHTVDGSTFDMEESMNKIEQLYSDAKDEIECAEDSKGTTYYHEDLATAKEAVNDVFDAYDHFIQSLPSEEMQKEVKQKVDMKMKELKMAFETLPLEED